VLFNLTIGVLYAWSILKSQLTAPISEGGYGWTVSQAGLPFSLAIIVFALAVLVGGRIQDKIGPNRVVTASGFFVGFGLILSGLIGNSFIGVTLSFGIIAGTGMGIGYSCLAPPALKWFHPSKKGLVSGLIVGGFGLSAVFYAPIAGVLLDRLGIEATLITLGAGALVLCMIISRFIKNPPHGYIPAAPANTSQSAKIAPANDYNWREMLQTKRFRLIFIMFLFASSVGLMVIGNMSKIAQTQTDISDAVILAGLVSFLALTNTLGRVAGGIMSDKIGRINSLFVIFTLQTLNMAVFTFYQNLPMLIVGIILVGFCFGTLLSVMPALCADMYGLKNFGQNYGILFLAWGFSGIISPIISDLLFDLTGSFNIAYIMCTIITGAMIFVNVLLKRDIHKLQAI